MDIAGTTCLLLLGMLIIAVALVPLGVAASVLAAILWAVLVMSPRL